MNNDLLISLRRTLVPIAVGAVAASAFGSHIAPESLESVVGGIISGVYYGALRFIETKIPNAGFLLGAKKQPVYVSPEYL
jgi:hypothetical protein